MKILQSHFLIRIFYFLYYFSFFHFTFNHTFYFFFLFFFFFFSSTRCPLSLPLVYSPFNPHSPSFIRTFQEPFLSPAPSLFFLFFFYLIPKLSLWQENFPFLPHSRTFQGAHIFVLLLIFVPNPVQMGQLASVHRLFFIAFTVMIWLILKLCLWACILVIWLCLSLEMFERKIVYC